MTRGPGLAAWVRRVVAGTLLMLLLVVGGTAFRVWQVARADTRDHADSIVVLGAAQYNGKPTEVFEARLVHAKKLFDAGVSDRIITSGGKAPGDTYTEGDAGARWLIQRGVPPDRVVAVGEGRDTLGTLQAVAATALPKGWQTAVIVSDPWHSLRATRMAEDSGLDAWSSPTHSGPIVQTRQTQGSYIFRETGALLFYRLTKTPADNLGGTSI